MKIRETQRRALSFLLAFLMMFSSIHPVFANTAPEPKDELEISDELIEPEKMSVQAFNKLSSNKEEFPSDLDGSKIETIVSEWITKDSVEDNDKDSLNQVWKDNSHQIIRMRINYALSGQHDYPEGAVNIEIPKNIVRDRKGNLTGYMSLAVPQAPDKSGLFSYVDNGDTYILTNTKKLPAATSGMFEMSIRGLKPSDIKDKATGYVTDKFNATISVNTKEDNIIKKTSNDLTANFDTFAKISGAYKNAPYDPIETYPFNFPNELRPEDSDKYVYVAYDVHAYSEANQPFSVSIKDNSTMNVNGNVVVLGYENTRNGKITKGTGTNKLDLGIVDGEYLSSGQNFFGKVYVAYSKDNMEAGVRYKLSNNIEYSMTALDDKEVTKTSAKSTKDFMLLKFEEPTGHFSVEKYGKGPYNFALNLLNDEKEVDTEYRVYTKGFGYKWTRPLDEDADDINSYGKVDYSMITTDYETRLFSAQDKVLDNEDFYFKKLRIDEPRVFDYGKYERNGYGYYENNNNAISYGPITQGYYGYIPTRDYSKYPDMKVSVSKDGNTFNEYATLSYKTGKPVFTKTDGSVIKGNTIDFPKDTIDYKVELTTKVPAILYDTHPTVTLKPSKYIKENLDKLFAETDTPNSYGLNKARLDTVLYDTDTPINTMQDDLVLRSFQYGSKLTKSLSYDGTSEYQKRNQNVRLKYNSTFTSQTNIQSREDLDTVIKNGLYNEETTQTWYDLLPKGVIPDTDTIRVTNGKVLDVDIIENYKDSGRIMLVVKTETEPSYSYELRRHSILGQDGYKNTIRLSFEANYSWMDISDFGDTLNNLIAYESDNKVIGNTTGLKGEPDDPSKGFNKYSKTAIKEDEVDLMKDLNKAHDNNSFVYANANNKLAVDTYSLTSVHKQVDVNGEGLYGDGLDNKLAKNVYENGRYSYRLRLKNTSLASSKNIKLYDNLENYVPTEDKSDFGDKQWKGEFLSVDVSQLKEKGINPVVYYSTKEGLVLDNTDDRSDNDLSNKSIWSTQVPSDKSKITAIAIDASKDLNGNDYELPVEDSISAFIHMKAPKVRGLESDPSKYELWYDKELGEDEKEEGLVGGAHAYNNLSSTHISISKDNRKESDELLVRHDYVKVGLKPYNIEVKKEFNDDNNRDGIRDEEVTIRLLANGEKTNHTITLNKDNNFADKFTEIEYLDNNAKPIKYTLVEENANEKYQFKIKNVEEAKEGKLFTVENYHEPERISVKGIKTWEDDNLTVRPKTVKLALYGNDKLVETKNISADADGNWNYSFDNVFKYENGKEIEYKVKELNVAHGYYVEETEEGLVNKYYPYGDVKLSKEVINKTDKTNKQEFTFTFYAKNKTTGEYDLSKYEYLKSNGEKGTLMTGSEFTLKDGQNIIIKDIHIDNKVSFKEKELPGYKLTNSLITDVNIKETSELKAVNEYTTKVSLPIKGTKTLEGRELGSYQFIFDIYNEDGKIIRSGSNRTDGDILFGSLEFDYEDLEKKVHKFTIRERRTDLAGYTIDDHIEEFSVTLEDNGDGIIKATPKFDRDGIVFNNKYEAKGDVNLVAYKRSATKFEDEQTKEVVAGSNDKLMNEYLFDFELVDKETGKVVSKGQNDKNGKITFDKLEFNQEDIGKTFVYTAKEIKGNYEDVIYDETEIEYTVKVSDNGDGTLSSDVTTKDLYTKDLGNEETVPIFGNKFKPGKLEVSKFITNGDPNKEFKFKIKFTGEEHLVPSGEFELNRETAKAPYKVTYEVYRGVAPDNIYLYEKEGNYEIKLPGKNMTWTTVNGKEYKSGDVVKYKVDATGKVTFEDSNINIDNEGNIKFKEILKPGKVLVKLDEVDGEKVLTIYPENRVIGESKHQEFYWGEDNPFGTEKKGDKLTRRGTGSSYLPTDVDKVVTKGKIMLVGNMNYMFRNSKATSLDLSSFDTSKVTYMSYMFNNLQATSLDLSSLDTSNVRDMSYMFQNSQATSLDLSSFDTSKVTNMNNMFSGSQATSLDLSSFDTSEVTSMGYMFQNSQATSLDLSSFDTSNVASMNSMFSGSQATSLDLSSFDTSRVTYMGYMFQNSQATSLDLSSFDTSKVTYMSYMFNNSQATSLDLSSFDTSKVMDMYGMFYDSQATTGYARTQADADKFNASSITYKPNTLTFVVGGTGYKPPVVKQQAVSSIQPTVAKSISLAQLSNLIQPYAATPTETPYALSKGYITEANTVVQSGTQGGVTWTIYKDGELVFSPTDGVEGTFNAMSDIDSTRPWSAYEGQYSSVRFEPGVKGGRSLSYMFRYSQATSLDLSSFDTSNVRNMSYMFAYSNANSLDLSSFDTSNVTDMGGMFSNSQATSLDLSSFDTSKVTNMIFMFGDSQATSLDLSNFDTFNVNKIWAMFDGSSVKELILSTKFKSLNNTDLPNKIETEETTGKWIRDDKAYGPWTSKEFIENYNPGKSGRYILEPKVKDWGINGGVIWELTDNNEIVFRPRNGVEGTFDNSFINSEVAKPWNDYEVDLIRFEKGVKANKSIGHMFANSQAKSIDVTNFDTSNATSMVSMFSQSQSTSIKGLTNLDTSNVTNMGSMFGASQAKTIDVSKFNTAKVTNMSGMFNSTQVTSLDLSNFDTFNVNAIWGMFGGSSVKELILSTKFKSLNNTDLPNKIETEETTGKWIRDDKAYGPWTSSEFMKNYSPEKAGRYILEPQPKEYKIIFNTNGNNGSVSPIETKKGEEITMPSGDSIYSLTKRFVKWNTKPDGKGTDYIPGNKYKDLSTPGKDITLYAIMEDRENTLNIENGEATFTLRHGEKITLDNLPKGLSYEIFEESENGWRLVETRNTEGIIESNETKESTFINAYEPGATSVQLNARKNLDGLGKEGFTFNLIENGKVIQTKESKESGNIQFDPLVYREEGTHTYTIKEVVGNDKTINYDTHEEKVIVKVTTDNKGDLVTNVEYDKDGVVFNNTTKEVELTVTNKVQNTTRKDTFYFDVTINGQTERIELKAGETKKLSGIKINSTYEVKEVDINKDYEVVGNVSQSGILDKDTNVTITNKYNPTLDFNFNLELTKNLEGRELQANEFEFIVVDEAGNTIAESSNDVNGKVEFGLIPITKLGTTTFKVKELPGNDSQITYDNSEKRIEVTASDTEIEDIKFYDDNNEVEELVFNNKFTPEIPEEEEKDFGKISITKNVTEKFESIEDKDYEVKVFIKDKDNNNIDDTFTYKSNKGLSNIVKNEDIIKIKDGETITIENLPEGTKVSIEEIVPEGFTLIKEASITEGIVNKDTTTALNLENEYTPTGSFRFKGSKLLLGRDIKDYRFTFSVIRDGELLQKVNNDEQGNILFEDIALTKEDIGKTYKYQIVEDDDKQRNIVYDQRVYEIEVSIKDDGKGNIIAEFTDPEITFTNAHREMPATGFNYNFYLPILILFVSLLLMRKRRIVEGV